MSVHNKKDWSKPVDHPDNHGAYVTNSKGEVTYRNNGGYSPGAMGGKTDTTNSSGDKKASSGNFLEDISAFFGGGAARLQNLFNVVPAEAEPIVPRRRGYLGSFDTTSSMERRVKLSLPHGLKRFYQSPDENTQLLKPLHGSSGIVFPYTPQIIITNSASYASRSPTQTNYPYQIYQNSQVSAINLLVQFTAQNEEEARYVLACIIFLRLVTKSFRNDDQDAGMPPPVCRLTGHGKNLLPNVPVVVQDFSLTLPNNVDYISVNSNPQAGPPARMTGAGYSRENFLRALDRSQTMSIDRVPTICDISVTMTPTYSRQQLKEYNIKDIANGRNLGFM